MLLILLLKGLHVEVRVTGSGKRTVEEAASSLTLPLVLSTQLSYLQPEAVRE